MWFPAKSVFLSLLQGVDDAGNRPSPETAAAYWQSPKALPGAPAARTLPL